MSGCSIPVIGDCDAPINYGESIDLTFNYQNEDGTPINLSSATVGVFSSTPPVIKDKAIVTITDALRGEVRFFLGREDALQLRRGRNNRFSIQVVFGAESDDVTPEIYIQVA